jgi:WD40 repeat protein
VVLTAGRDKVLRLWALTTDGPVIRAEVPTPDPVIGLAVAPDSRTLAVGSVREVTVYRIGPDGRPTAAATTATGQAVHRLAFAPDGDRLVFAALDNAVRVWRPGGPDGPARFAVHDGKVRGLGFTPDGRGLVALGTEGHMTLWDAGTGDLVREWQVVTQTCLMAGLAPDLRRAVTLQRDGTARVVPLPGGLTDP